MNPNDLPIQHLLLSLRPVNRALRAAVARQTRAAARLDFPDAAAVCTTQQQVGLLLDDVDEHLFQPSSTGREVDALCLNEEERAAEQQMRDVAARHGVALPLLEMTVDARLTPFEKFALLSCCAAEVDRSYERIFGYIMDDMTRRAPSVDLLCELASADAATRLLHRRELSEVARLRRVGLLQSCDQATPSLRTELRLGPYVFDYLLGSRPIPTGLWRDPNEVDLTSKELLLTPATVRRLERLGEAITRRDLDVVGIWGGDGGPADAAIAIAQAAGRPLRRLALSQVRGDAVGRVRILSAIHTTELLGAMLLVDVDAFQESEDQAAAALAAEALACGGPAIILIGARPWRPRPLMASRKYAELELPAPNFAARLEQWSALLPDFNSAVVEEIAGCYRMSHDEMRIVASWARVAPNFPENGHAVDHDESLRVTCAKVARGTPGRLLGDVAPRRTAADLVLPADVHRQVLEIAGFTRALPKVFEDWGFGKFASTGVGLKCLFTGDSGTGKTLAAEVVAGELGVPFLKVNLAETVSKWVGETEKNLELVFREASASNALLFFDEADALFGRRGEVRHGVDRFANMEVSYLLQRLEEHSGLVVLASNLTDNIDPAFTRRFQVVIHFPRPVEADRRRLWRMAFPADAPLEKSVDIAALARLDLTGAGIVSAARTAAFLAAQDETGITMQHVVQGVARQFRREARVLTLSELGLATASVKEKV